MGGCRRQIPTACNCFASHPLSNPFRFYRGEDFPVSARFFPFPPILRCLVRLRDDHNDQHRWRIAAFLW